MESLKVYRSPNWLKRHRKRGESLRLRILRIERQEGDRAQVIAFPHNRHHGPPHPARLRLLWARTHWTIEGKGEVTT